MRRPAWQLALLGALLAISLGATSVGCFVEEQAYLRPLMRIKAASSSRAHLPFEVRIVAADDSSIKAPGRLPTFAEWVSLADGFLKLGYERILIREPQDLAQSRCRGKCRSCRGLSPCFSSYLCTYGNLPQVLGARGRK